MVEVDGETRLSVSESRDADGSDRGPVNALSKALAKDLGSLQERIADMGLTDFRVRIMQGGTEAVTRVVIDHEDGAGRRWSTVGASPNIVDASFEALLDAVRWKLCRERTGSGRGRQDEAGWPRVLRFTTGECRVPRGRCRVLRIRPGDGLP